jgi:nucleotide-binding universal stress UspA family protein
MKFDRDTYLFVGVLGRSQLRHWLVGRSFRQILEDVDIPIFYARKAPEQIEKILICFGGLGYTKKAEEIGIEIGKMTDAKVSLLHIVPPVEAEQLPKKELPANEKELQATDAQAALILEKAQEHARAEGVQSRIVIRTGNVVNQILAELEQGQYDLVCMGSPFSDSGWRHHYLPNIAAEVAEAVDAPLMIARSS